MALGSPVDLVKARTDLVQLVSGYLPDVKKRGRNFWACCPFHSEKTPSFCMWPEDDHWKCFGCGLGGDALSFVMRIENLDFPGALKLLAEKAGVELDDRPRHPEENIRRRRLLDLNSAASLWFHGLLLDSPLGADARAFVERRKLTHQTVLDFQLGYAPESWDTLRNTLVERGYTVEEQLAVGLLSESDRGQQPYDRFRNRLIYPIRDAGGHIVAFGGRQLGDDKKGAKFINSPQSELFDKSATLYGLDRAKNAIRDRDQAIIVEGYMDAIMAHQHGETNAVCSMGTSLTERQVEQIKRLTNKVILALDPDLAGDIAAGRGVEIGREVFGGLGAAVVTPSGVARVEAGLGADIRVVHLPRGKDPDEVIDESVEEWRRLVAAAQPLVEYRFEQIVTKYDLSSPQARTDLITELATELQAMPDRLQRHHYLGRLAQRLARVAGLSQITEQELQVAMSRVKPRAPRRGAGVGSQEPGVSGLASATSAEIPDPAAAQPGDHTIAHARPPLTPDSRLPTPAPPMPLRLDAEDFLVMRALRYLDQALLWRDNLRTEEVAKSENREVFEYLQNCLDEGRTPTDPNPAVSDSLARHIELLREMAFREPEIPRESLPTEFDRLILSVRRQTSLRRQTERATLLSLSEEGTGDAVRLDEAPEPPNERGARQTRSVESGAEADLADLRRLGLELDRRTLLTPA